MANTCSIDRLIQTTRKQWEEIALNGDIKLESRTRGSASEPLIVSLHTVALCGLQSAHDFTGMGEWRANDDNSDDTVLAAA
jgi:hypothetical protein